MQRLLALVVALSIPGSLLAHNGGLNAEGCHHDRKNGGYHCHRKPNDSTNPGKPAKDARSNLNPDKGAVSYASCAEARAAGAAPLRTGDAGYSRRLDRDGDGVACE